MKQTYRNGSTFSKFDPFRCPNGFVLQSSSPSYLLLASLEAAAFQLEDVSLFDTPLRAAEVLKRIFQTIILLDCGESVKTDSKTELGFGWFSPEKCARF